MEACHANDDPSDNRLENLRWDTRSENLYDRVRNGIFRNGFTGATHCGRGHEFTEENTLYTKRGNRMCRECRNAAARRRYAEKREPKTNRTHCSRGHELVHPNLRLGQLPRKDCRSCHNAHSYAGHHDMKDRIQELADSYYKKYMGT